MHGPRYLVEQYFLRYCLPTRVYLTKTADSRKNTTSIKIFQKTVTVKGKLLEMTESIKT